MKTIEGFYDIHVDCRNCQRRREIRIEKGKTVAETPCPCCGVTALEASPVVTL